MADPNLKIKIEASDETRAAFEAVKRSMETTATTAAKMGAEVQKTQGGMRSLGGIAQQAGYQIGDFASQVAAGGSAITAFVQQGSQMLGMFGMMGAIGGAALAIGGVAYQMWAARDAAKGATDEVSALTAEIKRLNEESAKRGGGQPGIRANVMLEDLMAERRRLVGMLPSTGGTTAATSEMQGFIEAQAASEVSRIQGQIDAIDKLIREYDRLVMEQERVDESAAVLKRRGEEFEDQKKREAEAIREVERAQQAFTDRIRQTILQLDPAAAAAELYADQQLLLRTALEDGMIAQDQYTALLATAGAAYESAIRALDRYGKALDQQAQRLREQLDPHIAIRRELDQIEELYRTGRISADEWAKASEMARAKMDQTARKSDEIARELGFTFQSAFEDAIVRGEKLRGVLAGIGQDIARLILRQTVTTPFANLASGALKSAGSWFSGLFGAGTMSTPNAPWLGLPGFADGGPVSGGRPIIVGEEGPEVFVPHSAGQIIPNGESMGGAVVNQTINISVGVAQTVRAELASLMPAIKRQTIDAVADARMRGGSFAAAMGT